MSLSDLLNEGARLYSIDTKSYYTENFLQFGLRCLSGISEREAVLRVRLP